MRRFFLLLFLLPLDLYAQGAGTPPYRGLNNWSLIFGTDNVFDIGATSSQRPRTGYFGTSIITPSLTVSGLTPTRVPFASTGGLLADDADLTFDGATLRSTNLSLSSGLVGTNSLTFPDGGNTVGFYKSAANILDIAVGGTQTFRFSANGFFFPVAAGEVIVSSGGGFSISSGTAGVQADDAGIGRHAANVLKCTNGSTSVRCLLGGGAAVASAAALPVPTGGVFHVTGTTGITSITSTNLGTGVCITLIFDASLTVTDGSNLKLAGDFNATADDTLGLCFDGTNWYETHRSAN